MPETKLAIPPQEEEQQPDTEGEFKALWTEANEGRDRLSALARAATEAGHPEIAKVYAEISETVMGLITDITMATGAAIMSCEDDIQELEEAEDEDADTPTESALLQEDADKYLQLFAQYIRLFDGLAEVIPAGADGDAQREVFATLRRMTEGMMEFTESIIIEDEPEPGKEGLEE